MTAKDNKGRQYRKTKSYYQIGLDLDGYMRYGAWQIKEFIDLSLQPKTVHKEQVVFEFDKDVQEAEVTVNVYYYISGKKGDIIYTKSKTLTYE